MTIVIEGPADDTPAHEDAVLLAFVGDPALDGADPQRDLVDVDEGVGVEAPGGTVHLDDLAALVLDGERPANDDAVDPGKDGLTLWVDHLLVLEGLDLFGHGVLPVVGGDDRTSLGP